MKWFGFGNNCEWIILIVIVILCCCNNDHCCPEHNCGC